MKLDKYDKVVKKIPLERKLLIRKNIKILKRIHFLLKEKFEGKQKLLAKTMGISEAAVSKMINGYQNFTEITIIKLEMAFDAPITNVEDSLLANKSATVEKIHFNQPSPNVSKTQTYILPVDNAELIQLQKGYFGQINAKC